MSDFSKNTIVMDGTNNPTPPDKSTQTKIYLDKSDGLLKRINYNGTIVPLTPEQEIKYYETKVEAEADQTVLSFTLPNPLKLVSNLEVALKKLIEGNKQEALSNFQETLATLKSYQDSQNLANGIVDKDLRDIEGKISDLISSVENKVSSSDFQATINKLSSDLITLIKNINDTLAQKATKKELEVAISETRAAIPKLPEPINIVADSSNVTINKRENEIGIEVDIPKITKEIIHQGAGVSRATVQSLIDNSISTIDLSNYTPLSTTASISGDLQNQINQIVQEGTTVASSGGSIIVTQQGTHFNLEVASAPIQNHNLLDGLQGIGGDGGYWHLTEDQYNDYIGASEVAVVSGGLNSRINTLETNTNNITGGLAQLDSRFVNVTGDTMTGSLVVNGTVTCLSGSAATPGFNFSTEPDCGMYLVGANNIAFATNGTQRVSVSDNTTLVSTTLQVNNALTVFRSINTNINAAETYGQLTGGTNSSEYASIFNNPSIQNVTAAKTGNPVSLAANRTKVSTNANYNANTSVRAVAGWYDKGDLGVALGGGTLAISAYYGGYLANLPALASGVTLGAEYGLYIEQPTRGLVNYPLYVANGMVYFGDGLTVASISGSSGNLVTHDATGKLLDSGVNVSTISGGPFVKKSGDTMTGNLIITSDTSDPALQINSDGDARIRLNNPTGGENYSELSFAITGSDRYGLYNLENGSFGFYDYVTGKDRLNYYPLTNGWIFNTGYEGNVTPLIVRGYNDTLFSVVVGSDGYDGRIIMNPDAEIGSVRIMNSSDDSAEISWATPNYVNGNVASGNDIFSIRGNITNETLSVYSYPLSANVVNIDVNTGDTTFGYDVTFDTLADITGANSLVAHDANGKIFSTGLAYTDLATRQEVYNLDVDLQGQIVNVLNPAEVSNISGSSVTIDSFPHYSEIGSVKWLVHLDDGTNVRFSQVASAYIPNSTIKFTEEFVESIGTTTDAVLSVTTDATNVYLKLTSSNLWNFKTKRINL